MTKEINEFRIASARFLGWTEKKINDTRYYIQPSTSKRIMRVAFWAPDRDPKQREMIEDKIRSLGCSIGWFLTQNDSDITIHQVRKPEDGNPVKSRGIALMEVFMPFLESIESQEN